MSDLLIPALNKPGTVKIDMNEMIEIKGALFTVTTISQTPKYITLTPANEDVAERYRQTTREENINRPQLSEPPAPDATMDDAT